MQRHENTLGALSISTAEPTSCTAKEIPLARHLTELSPGLPRVLEGARTLSVQYPMICKHYTTVPNVQFASIQYHGEPGITQSCVRAIVRLIHFGDRIGQAALLSHKGEHCFLLTIDEGERVAIKAGFSSGYHGEGPKGLATALELLQRHGSEIQEYTVAQSIIVAVNDSALLRHQLEAIQALMPIRPTRWYDYIYFINGAQSDAKKQCYLNRLFPATIPYACLDHRLMDIALRFEHNPDASLMTAFRRLEDVVRQRAGIGSESSTRLFTKAFQGDRPILSWKGVDQNEQKARANLFDAIYRAYRNPRAHREREGEFTYPLREFILLNELFLLEGQSAKLDPM